MFFFSDIPYSDVVTRVYTYDDSTYKHYIYSIGKKNQQFNKYYLLTVLNNRDILVKDINEPMEILKLIHEAKHEVLKGSSEYTEFLKCLSLAQIDRDTKFNVEELDNIINIEEQEMYGKKTR